MRRIVDGLTDADLGRSCQRPPAPGYPDEDRTAIEHYRFAVRDLEVLESR
jgi:hypothetical protein